MSMKRHRGFQLGRKLVTFLRRTCQFRRRNHYLHLNSHAQSFRPFSKIVLASKSFNWGKQLKQLLYSSKDELYTPLISCDSRHNYKAPPKGHLAVYVAGDEKGGGSPRRFVVPIVYFNHPLFGELLEAEEEFGYGHPGGITIPCPVSKFECVQTRIATGAGRICRRTKWIC